MDTDWFAVDRDGHVGYFDTGEPGAMPIDLYSGGSPGFDLFDLLLDAGSVGRPLDDLRGWLTPGPLGQKPAHWTPSEFNGLVRLYLTTLEPVLPLLAQGSASTQQTREGFAVLVQEPETAWHHGLHERGLCLACFRQWWGDELLADAAALGCFAYHCQGYARPNDQFGVTAPYGRKKLPEFPIHVDQLPPAARRYVLRTRFKSLCFAETIHIQPVEFFACASYDELAFLSGDGTCILPQEPGSEDFRRFSVRILEAGLPEGLVIRQD